MWSNIIKLQGPTSTSHFSVQDKKAFHALKMDVIFNVLKSVGRITTHCVTFKTACVKISVNVITCWRGMIFVFLCAVLKRNARRAILNKLSSTQETPQLLFLKRVCVCVSDMERAWVSVWMSDPAVCLGGLFVLISSLLLSVPMLPPSPMQQGQVWKVCKIYHLPLMKPLPLSPFLNSFLSLLSPVPRPPPGYLYWSVGPLLCASLLFICSAESKAGLHSLSILPTHNVNSLCYSFAYDKAFRHQLHFFPIK